MLRYENALIQHPLKIKFYIGPFIVEDNKISIDPSVEPTGAAQQAFEALQQLTRTNWYEFYVQEKIVLS